MSIAELDENLRQFYAEARNKEGENYSRATLMSLRNGIERFLNTPPNNLGISLTNNPQFVLSNKMLDAKIKQLKKDGLQNTTHKPAIELEDLEKLKNGDIFSLTQPLSLLRNVWFHISLFWCRRGFEGQRSLKKSSFAFGEDAKGDHFVTMSHDEMTKNHPGGVSDVESESWVWGTIPVSKKKLATFWQDLVRKPAPRHKQAVNLHERYQLRCRSFPCLYKSLGESDSDNLVGKCWPNKSGNYGNIWSSQRVEPSKLSQHAVGKSTSQLQRHPLHRTGWCWQGPDIWPASECDCEIRKWGNEASSATAASKHHLRSAQHKLSCIQSDV